MTYVTHSPRTTTRPVLAELRANLAQRRAQFRAYRATVNELSNLTDRELHDLGVLRADIRSIAQEAAYGV